MSKPVKLVRGSLHKRRYYNERGLIITCVVVFTITLMTFNILLMDEITGSSTIPTNSSVTSMESPTATTTAYDQPQPLSKESCLLLMAELMKEGRRGITMHQAVEGISMYIYKDNDIVSNSLLRTGQWATAEKNGLHQALNAFAKRKNLTEQEVIFLDIGANVGSFSLTMASYGFSVVAFEAFGENSDLIQASICKNSFEHLITLHSKALGAATSACVVYSDVHNYGDGHTQCGEQQNIVNDTFLHEGVQYNIRARIESVRLDDVLASPKIRSKIGAVKMDVEGYETHVVQGGQGVLLNSKIPCIFTEFSPGMIRDKGGNPADFVNTFIDAGYTAHSSFSGPALSANETNQHGELWFILG